MLPLMYIYELNDIMFLVKSLKSPTDNFDIKTILLLPATLQDQELIKN